MKRELMVFIISLFILVVAWIVFSVYHNSITSTIPDALSLRILSISNSFDTQTIDTLKKRTQITPLFDIGIATATAQPTISPTPSPVSQISVTPIPTLSASSSAVSTSGGTIR